MAVTCFGEVSIGKKQVLALAGDVRKAQGGRCELRVACRYHRGRLEVSGVWLTQPC